ncbi:hypothetical protein KQ284_11975 [Klebsiella pneumoniae]|jgi:hypothetical protein|uniref:hypothetical protein n=1 Tax=Klebsiella pneumoniae TaxID=573 RepID=UPI001033C298|nr:hypothetical protein [Klebsiella pneumoniae]MBK0456443.1 hypothetical protein [Klebsiella pneumoniae]MCS6377624.1 hypothetical protein [Klebsiella pneumoniae]MCX2310081.1 hypothetical protein [Klebsiella pneumoniae]MCY0520714.1 hypothetical protein [Klebsiella pneumoniae]MDC6712266.1 hypothetical protein [Klebsiella pneumoniae]
MSDVTTQDIDDALERAQSLKANAEEFMDIADDINNAACIRMEDERGTRKIPLDDIPLGEEALRVKEDMPGVDTAIQILEDLAEGKIPTTEVSEKFQEAMEDLDTLDSTLQDVGAEDVIKASQSSDDDYDFQGDQDDETYDDEEYD